MAENKRYYWLRLYEDLFTSRRIKKLRRLGADFFIIYLKLQLISLKNDGYIYFDGFEESLASELVDEIDEDVEKIQVTLSYLQSCGLLVPKDDNTIFLPYVEKCTGSETASARRMRKHRNNKELERLSIEKASQCDKNVTTEIRDKSIEIRDKNINNTPKGVFVEQDSTNTEQIKEIILYLNEKAGKNFSWNGTATKRLINARLNENYSVDDFKKVIDNKVAEWKDDAKMSKYLQPSTLFAPSHFDEYLNQDIQGKGSYDYKKLNDEMENW